MNPGVWLDGSLLPSLAPSPRDAVGLRFPLVPGVQVRFAPLLPSPLVLLSGLSAGGGARTPPTCVPPSLSGGPGSATGQQVLGP